MQVYSCKKDIQARYWHWEVFWKGTNGAMYYSSRCNELARRYALFSSFAKTFTAFVEKDVKQIGKMKMRARVELKRAAGALPCTAVRYCDQLNGFMECVWYHCGALRFTDRFSFKIYLYDRRSALEKYKLFRHVSTVCCKWKKIFSFWIWRARYNQLRKGKRGIQITVLESVRWGLSQQGLSELEQLVTRRSSLRMQIGSCFSPYVPGPCKGYSLVL